VYNARRAGISDTALRFARYFKGAPVFWMNPQTRYDLQVAEDEIAAKVGRDVRPLELLVH
jgi:plasmid maintenance system antidote protein VapI